MTMLNAKNCSNLAEREGFEPSVPVTQYARLAIWCLRPLGHLSAFRRTAIVQHRSLARKQIAQAPAPVRAILGWSSILTRQPNELDAMRQRFLLSGCGNVFPMIRGRSSVVSNQESLLSTN